MAFFLASDTCESILASRLKKKLCHCVHGKTDTLTRYLIFWHNFPKVFANECLSSSVLKYCTYWEDKENKLPMWSCDCKDYLFLCQSFWYGKRVQLTCLDGVCMKFVLLLLRDSYRFTSLYLLYSLCKFSITTETQYAPLLVVPLPCRRHRAKYFGCNISFFELHLFQLHDMIEWLELFPFHHRLPCILFVFWWFFCLSGIWNAIFFFVWLCGR